MAEVAAIVSAGCALVVTVLVVLRFGGKDDEPGGLGAGIRPVQDWEQYAAVGHRDGSPDAPFVILEFSDFECPFCGRLARDVIPQLKARYGDSLQLVYRHLLMPFHAHARRAALALECAAESGQAPAMKAAIFEHQDSLGLIAFSEVARRAGIRDHSRIDACVEAGDGESAIIRDSLAAKALGASRTPTLVLNGRLVEGVPTVAVFDSILRLEPIR